MAHKTSIDRGKDTILTLYGATTSFQTPLSLNYRHWRVFQATLLGPVLTPTATRAFADFSSPTPRPAYLALRPLLLCSCVNTDRFSDCFCTVLLPQAAALIPGHSFRTHVLPGQTHIFCFLSLLGTFGVRASAQSENMCNTGSRRSHAPRSALPHHIPFLRQWWLDIHQGKLEYKNLRDFKTIST